MSKLPSIEPLQRATVPVDADPDTNGWWQALAEGVLLIPHCLHCDRHFFPPTPSCPHCGSAAVEQLVSDGRATIYSWIVVHQALDPLFTDHTPYTVAAVHLTEGARLFGRIANGPLHDGMSVRAATYTVDGVTLLGFERA